MDRQLPGEPLSCEGTETQLYTVILRSMRSSLIFQDLDSGQSVTHGSNEKNTHIASVLAGLGESAQDNLIQTLSIRVRRERGGHKERHIQMWVHISQGREGEIRDIQVWVWALQGRTRE